MLNIFLFYIMMIMMMMMMMMMMMNCFCGMVDRRIAFSLISSRDQGPGPRAGFEPAQNLSSGLVEWNCAVVITTTPRLHKTHTLIFYLILVLKALNRQVSLFFFHFYSWLIFCKKPCNMIIWFWHQIFSSSFCCGKFNISMFSHILLSFSKKCIIHQLKKIFFKIVFSFF